MHHRSQETKRILEELERNGNHIKEWEDIYHGTAYLDAVRAGNIKDEDMVLLMSIDGAQLYQNKQSDCWIYIWVILDLPLDARYKKLHVFPGGFIPGPNKPKNVDSFIFPGLHHVAAFFIYLFILNPCLFSSVANHMVEKYTHFCYLSK